MHRVLELEQTNNHVQCSNEITITITTTDKNYNYSNKKASIR